jgi:hypothetical protein
MSPKAVEFFDDDKGPPALSRPSGLLDQISNNSTRRRDAKYPAVSVRALSGQTSPDHNISTAQSV